MGSIGAGWDWNEAGEFGYFDGDGCFTPESEIPDDFQEETETRELPAIKDTDLGAMEYRNRMEVFNAGFSAGYKTAIDDLYGKKPSEKFRRTARIFIHEVRYKFDRKYRASIDDIPF